MALKLLQSIRLDPSDTFIFERAAEPGEWVIPGAFMFWEAEPDKLEGKARQAFRAGFLGLGSFGWSTLAVVKPAREADRLAAIEQLAAFLLAHHGAPDLGAARRAGEEELAFAMTLAAHPLGTIVALQRTWEEGEIRERFRTLKPSPNSNLDHSKARAFAVIEEDGAAEEEDEAVDLVGMARGESGSGKA